MRMYDLILKKRQGNVLTKDEIDWMIREYTDDSGLSDVSFVDGDLFSRA